MPIHASNCKHKHSIHHKPLCLLCRLGDNSKVAAQVANVVGISHFEAELKPEDKLAYVERFNGSMGNVEKGTGAT